MSTRSSTTCFSHDEFISLVSVLAGHPKLGKLISSDCSPVTVDLLDQTFTLVKNLKYCMVNVNFASEDMDRMATIVNNLAGNVNFDIHLIEQIPSRLSYPISAYRCICPSGRA